MSSIYSPMPKEVLQDTNYYHCWAAVAESWVSSIPSHPYGQVGITQSDFIKLYDKYTDSNGGLTIKKGFAEMAADLDMNIQVFLSAKNLSTSFLYQKLLKHKYLYLFFAGGSTGLGNTLGHASVIYGIGSSTGGANVDLGVMDPWIRGIWIEKLSKYHKAKELVIGWYKHPFG